MLTLPGRSLPILNGLYIRSLVYSSDRMAMEILARDSLNTISRKDVAVALLRRGFSKEARRLIDNSHALQNRDEKYSQMSRIEKLMLRLGSVEPPLMDRVHAIMDTSGKHAPLL